MSVVRGMYPSPNPWGREYAPSEWKAAKHMWPQYKQVSEDGRGPLIYASPEPLRELVREAIVKAERKLAALRIVQDAVDRESQNGWASEGCYDDEGRQA